MIWSPGHKLVGGTRARGISWPCPASDEEVRIALAGPIGTKGAPEGTKGAPETPLCESVRANPARFRALSHIAVAPLPLDLADATLIWLGYETGLREIMTIDVKDFARYRLPDGDALEVL